MYGEHVEKRDWSVQSLSFSSNLRCPTRSCTDSARTSPSFVHQCADETQSACTWKEGGCGEGDTHSYLNQLSLQLDQYTVVLLIIYTIVIGKFTLLGRPASRPWNTLLGLLYTHTHTTSHVYLTTMSIMLRAKFSDHWKEDQNLREFFGTCQTWLWSRIFSNLYNFL